MTFSSRSWRHRSFCWDPLLICLLRVITLACFLLRQYLASKITVFGSISSFLVLEIWIFIGIMLSFQPERILSIFLTFTQNSESTRSRSESEHDSYTVLLVVLKFEPDDSYKKFQYFYLQKFEEGYSNICLAREQNCICVASLSHC